MKVIDWDRYRPTDTELASLRDELTGIEPLRAFLKRLVKITLQEYPWDHHAETVPLFDGAQAYAVGDRVAIPQPDPQNLRPDTWQIGRISDVQEAGNPAQGTFQVVTIRIGNKRRKMAAHIAQGNPLSIAVNWDDVAIEWLTNHIIESHYNSLLSAVKQAIADSRLDVVIEGDRVISGQLLPLSEAEKALIADLFTEIGEMKPWIEVAEIIEAFRKSDHLDEATDDIASLRITRFLKEKGYRSVGNDRWTTSTHLARMDRDIVRHPSVPRISSQIARQRAEVEPDEPAYDDAVLDEEAIAQIADLEGKAEPETVPAKSLDEWRRTAPSGKIRLPTLTYQHITMGYLPLTGALSSLFPPDEDPLAIDIIVIDSPPIKCLVSRKKQEIKAIDQYAFYRCFQDKQIMAGTHLWLERQSNSKYYLAPQWLAEPREVLCKQAWIEDNCLHFSQVEIPILYEGDEHIFKSEIRFEDPDALFAEAESSGLSIAHALYRVFDELGADNPGVKMHYSELFNAVFFQHRMCSPHSVIHELYSRPCFVRCGNGYFAFNPELGFDRRTSRRRRATRGRTSRMRTQPSAQIPIDSRAVAADAAHDEGILSLESSVDDQTDTITEASVGQSPDTAAVAHPEPDEQLPDATTVALPEIEEQSPDVTVAAHSEIEEQSFDATVAVHSDLDEQFPDAAVIAPPEPEEQPLDTAVAAHPEPEEQPFDAVVAAHVEPDEQLPDTAIVALPELEEQSLDVAVAAHPELDEQPPDTAVAAPPELEEQSLEVTVAAYPELDEQSPDAICAESEADDLTEAVVPDDDTSCDYQAREIDALAPDDTTKRHTDGQITDTERTASIHRRSVASRILQVLRDFLMRLLGIRLEKRQTSPDTQDTKS